MICFLVGFSASFVFFELFILMTVNESTVCEVDVPAVGSDKKLPASFQGEPCKMDDS